MLERLKDIQEKYEDLGRKLSDPEVLGSPNRFRTYAQAHAGLQPLAEKIKEYQEALRAIDEAREMKTDATDPEWADFLSSEIRNLSVRRDALEGELKEMLVAGDPNDEKDIVLEIRAGAGGQEAALFAAELYRLYSNYAEARGWKSEVMTSSPSDLGGFKEIIVGIQGDGAYSRLKFESGVHRVQRVPVTESGGRIHTSTVTVAVLPEAEDVELEMNPKDIRIDIFRSSGPGGQSVNTTDSAVRVTHLPTGMVVSCQEERSQLQNRERALRILRARLYERMIEEQHSEVAAARKLQVGTGDRSERIRTYNFPQNRVTDHRIGLTLHRLGQVLEGDIDELVDALSAADRAEKLKQVV